MKGTPLSWFGTNSRTTDGSGAVVDAKQYDAFGLPTQMTNPSGSQAGFAGGYGIQEDRESGLELMGHRYYDPGTGRFITRDPIGSGLNWYRYADNNPLKQVDPLGLQLIPITPQTDAANGTDYYARIEARINSLRANGETKAADELQKMLESGQMYIETEPAKLTHKYPDGTTYIAGAQTPRDGSAIVFGKDTLKGSSSGLESTLLHEWVHVNDAHKHVPPSEQGSTYVTARYADLRKKKKMPDSSETDWGPIGRDQRAYGKRWASHDFPLLIPYIFKGFPW